MYHRNVCLSRLYSQLYVWLLICQWSKTTSVTSKWWQQYILCHNQAVQLLRSTALKLPHMNNYLTQVSSNITDGCIRLLFYFLLSPVLNLNLVTCYCDWDSLQLPSFPPGTCTSMSASFHVLYLFFTNHLSFTAVYSRSLTALSYKTQGFNEPSHFTGHNSNFKLGKIMFVFELINQTPWGHVRKPQYCSTHS